MSEVKRYSFLGLEDKFTTGDGNGNPEGIIVDLDLAKDEDKKTAVRNLEKQDNLQEENVKKSDIASEIKEEIKIEEHELIDTYAKVSYKNMKAHGSMDKNNIKCDACAKTDYFTIPFFEHQVCLRCEKTKSEMELREILANKANDIDMRLPETSAGNIKSEHTLQHAGLPTASDESTPIVVSDDDEEYIKENIRNDVQETETMITPETDAGTYKCELCPYEGSVFNLFLKHRSRKHSNEYAKRLLKCSLCNVHFPYKDLMEHKKKMHGRIKCTECTFTTNSAELFKSHMWEHENHKICDICGQTEYLTFTFFSSQVCTQCKKGKNEADLRALLANSKSQKKQEFEHVFLIEDSNKNDAKKGTEFICTTCSFETNTYISFRKHILEKNTYMCYDPPCTCTFTCLSSLSRHILERHQFKIPERCETFKCSFCCYSSVLLPKVLNHQQFVHNIAVNKETRISQENDSAAEATIVLESVLEQGGEKFVFQINKNIYANNKRNNKLVNSVPIHFQAEEKDPEIILLDDDEVVEIVDVDAIKEVNNSSAVHDKISAKYKRLEKPNKRIKNNLHKTTVVTNRIEKK